MNFLFFLLSFSPLLLLINASIYYVNVESLQTTQTGSLTNPFTSIAQAYSSLGAITCELVLLGSSASISTTIAFAAGSNYTIRPDASFTSANHFPVYLQSGAVVQTSAANLVLQKIRFVELNLSRATNNPFLVPSASSNLTLQNVLLKGTRTTAKYYFFCKASDSFVHILNSEFRNLTDSIFSFIRSPVVVHGSTFKDIKCINTGFMTFVYFASPNDGIRFKNNSFENIYLGVSPGTSVGFFYSILSRLNTTFEDFSINNVTFETETPFWATYSSSISNADTQNDQTAVVVQNGVIQNMFEKPKVTLSNAASTNGYSLFIYSNGPSILKVHNLSVTNCIFTNLSLIAFTSVSNEFINVWKVLPSVELTDITLKYTRNANFLLNFIDTANISNVYLEGLSMKDVTITNSLFQFISGHRMNVYNVTANNVSGPLFSTVNVNSHNFSTLSLNNMSTSQKLVPNSQNIIYISKNEDFGFTGLDPNRPRDSFFDRINLNEFTLIDGIDSAKSANSSLVIAVFAAIGRVYVTNSLWYNNLLSGLYGTVLYLEVDNVTIDNDPELPSKQTLPHKGFALTTAQEIVIKNSVFQNNKNFVIFHYSNSLRIRNNGKIIQTRITVENSTICNNSAVLNDANTQYSSLFIIYSPTKPIDAWFRNSYFENNKIFNGLIKALENYQANLELTNNTFDSNYATQSGAVFSSTNMRQTTSTLNLKNNIFTNNKCDQNGGVFSFISTDYNMHSVNNSYFHNTAGLAGGVGYAFRASFVFLEEQGVYSNNSAGSLGGTWYLSLNTYQANLQSLTFSQTSFVNSIAKQKGGSLYLDNGGMTINHCTFNASQAGEAGGNFYISIGNSIDIIDSNFTSSSAPQGSFVYAEDIYGSLNIDRAQVVNISFKGPILTSSSGSLSIKDSAFENINSSLLLLSDVTTLIANVTFNKISCPISSSSSFCLLKVISSDSVQITNSSITNIRSNVDLISLMDSDQVLLSKLKAQNMLKLNKDNLEQIFVLNALNTKNLHISQSNFSKIGFSGVKTKNSNIKIQDSIFSNKLTTTSRFLSQSISDNDISSAKLIQPIQFMILESSSSTLAGTSFIENSLNTLVNGGAIQIHGSGGVHTLTDCIFENTQASNGGALFVKGQANSISISNSQFENNQVSGNGGALYFADQSVQNTLLISQTAFYQNAAIFGGAVYLGNQALIVDSSSSFTENHALKGGAIATKSATKNALVNLKQSSFIRNSASEGAALIALQEMNFEYSTSSFTGNTATSGGDLASTPTSLRLKIYSFESYFLFINKTTSRDILSNHKTVIIYDSLTADASESIPFISGVQPNMLFEITILDALGQEMGSMNDAQGEFQLSSSSSSSSLVGLLGSTTFEFTNSTAHIFKAFSVKGPFETTVTLSIEGTYLSQTSNSIQSLPKLELPIILGKCSVGQIYEKSSAICSSCSVKTYSLANPFKTQSCQTCLENAVCLGGSIMYPAQGYWRIDGSSLNLIKCPQSDSCLGGSKDHGKNISLTGFCGEGYEGLACSSCSEGYARFGSSQSCANCKESKLYYVMFGGYLFIQAVAIIFSTKMNLEDSLKKKSVVRSALIKIVIDFVQILTLVSEFNFNFPSVLNSMYDGISKILPTNIDALSVDCFITLKKGNEHVFFNKVLVILVEPFAYIIMAFVIWGLIFRIRKESVFGNPDFKYNIYLTIIVIIYVLQPGIIKIMFELFNCKNYGSSDNPKYHLVYDVNIECWKHEHLVWGLCLAVPTLIIGLLLPFVILAYWTRDRDLKAAVRVQKAYSFIFKPYQNKAFFWELAVLLRKVLLIIISIFITSHYLQAYLAFSLLGLYYCLLYKISPYNIPQLNFAEAISVGSSAFILYSGLYSVRVQEMDTTSYILFVCDIISGISFVGYVIYLFLKKNAPTIQRKISRLGSKVLTNIKAKTHAKKVRVPALQSPTSLHLNAHNDSPMSTERIISLEGVISTERFMSTDRFTTTEHFMSTERFTTTEQFMSTERFMTTEQLPPTDRVMSTDRPLSPVIKLRPSEEEMSIIKENDELIIFSPANQTQAGLFMFGSEPRESSLPVDFQELALPAEDPVQEFAETFKHEAKNSPRRSGRNKLDRVFKFTKEDWMNELSVKNSEKAQERKLQKSF